MWTAPHSRWDRYLGMTAAMTQVPLSPRLPGIPRGGRVNIRVKAMNDGNAELLGWMLAPTDPRDFSVKFKNTIDGKDMKELKGTGCYCVKYKEYWADGEEHYEDIEIVCQKLENGPVAFENPWK